SATGRSSSAPPACWKGRSVPRTRRSGRRSTPAAGAGSTCRWTRLTLTAIWGRRRRGRRTPRGWGHSCKGWAPRLKPDSRGKRKRAAGNPLSADGPDVLFLLPKVEDTGNVGHTFREGKSRRKKRTQRPSPQIPHLAPGADSGRVFRSSPAWFLSL